MTRYAPGCQLVPGFLPAQWERAFDARMGCRRYEDAPGSLAEHMPSILATVFLWRPSLADHVRAHQRIVVAERHRP